ncbi:hypothetical protein [Streptomyces cyaneofuscatus]|uniref:hypothetical protein n=1 Tax=Streptomyces cyaneofuscatus TaxID=66883 RepID=UPI002E0F8C7B|nr:hypothetical protein OG366_00020 [Streptomyces cyaneofuscatus]WSI52744.1 hypothetical protein OG366_37140 [Streptomyces cyaneofuscatus]
MRRLRPAGPPDPRAAERLVPFKRTAALTEEELLERAAVAGPFDAAAALAAAEDAGADGYAIVLHRLVEAGPAAWTADVPAMLAALGRSAARPRQRPALGPSPCASEGEELGRR